jgi:hypothetical protein
MATWSEMKSSAMFNISKDSGRRTVHRWGHGVCFKYELIFFHDRSRS